MKSKVILPAIFLVLICACSEDDGGPSRQVPDLPPWSGGEDLGPAELMLQGDQGINR